MYFSGILVLEPGSTCKVILERNRNLRKGLVFIHHGLGLHSNDISKPQGLRKEVLSPIPNSIFQWMNESSAKTFMDNIFLSEMKLILS